MSTTTQTRKPISERLPSDYLEMGRPSESVFYKVEYEDFAKAILGRLVELGDKWRKLSFEEVTVGMSSNLQRYYQLCRSQYEAVAAYTASPEAAASFSPYWK
jgi:hypothetical protein